MKLLEIPVWVEDDFEIPECERLEYRFPKEGELYHNGVGKIFHTSTINFENVTCFVAVQKKEITYDWPELFEDGTELIKDCANHWTVKFPHTQRTLVFSYIKDSFRKLPPPPEDAPDGTVIVKGEK